MKKCLYIFVLLPFISCGQQEEKKAEMHDDYLTIYTADSARADYKKGNYRFLAYGLRVLTGNEDSVKAIESKYGIYYYEAAGCEVNDEFIAGANSYNNEMKKLLEKKNGKGWYEKYSAEVNEYLERERARDKENDTTGTGEE